MITSKKCIIIIIKIYQAVFLLKGMCWIFEILQLRLRESHFCISRLLVFMKLQSVNRKLSNANIHLFMQIIRPILDFLIFLCKLGHQKCKQTKGVHPGHRNKEARLAGGTISGNQQGGEAKLVINEAIVVKFKFYFSMA